MPLLNLYFRCTDKDIHPLGASPRRELRILKYMQSHKNKNKKEKKHYGKLQSNY